MPLIESNYRPPLLFRNGHFSTVFASGLRRITNVKQYRTQLPTPDGDILDLDWSYASMKTDILAIIVRVLEVSSTRPYMSGSARALNGNHINEVCVNHRGCGGHTNELYTSYHSGKTDDLNTVVESIVTSK